MQLKHGNEDQQKAAEMKMYGKLTREYHEWEPCSLLCKRFNVPEPNKRSSVITSARNKKPTFHIFDCLQDTSSSYSKSEPEKEPEPSPKKEEILLEEIPLPPARTQEIIFEEPKEKIDLFKAIFLDSDDEEENKSEKEEEDKIDEISTRNLYEDERITNEKRNTSPPRGCFENIDLDSLAVPSKEFSKKTIGNDLEKKKEVEVLKNQDVDMDMAYGPKLPDKVLFTSQTVSNVPVISDNSEKWIEKKDHEKKHKKKDKKHKKDKDRDKDKDKDKDKHKSKHKHKKHKK